MFRARAIGIFTAPSMSSATTCAPISMAGRCATRSIGSEDIEMSSAAFLAKPTVLDLAEALEAGRTTSRDLVEAALARIADPKGEGARTFVAVYGDSARVAADAQDRLRRAGYVASPLAGLPVSVKDLFDIAGERSLAGSKALDDTPPAGHDAPAIARM